MKKRLLTIVMTACLAAGAMAGCGSNATQQKQGEETQKTEAQETVNEPDETITLNLLGPGLLSSQGEAGALDMITGLETPGYNVIIDRWNELHPNVKLHIETAPWDNWQSVVQTAALSGDLDVILHGATLTALVEPLDEYIAADPDFASKIYTTETRRTTDYNDLSIPTTTGVPYTLNAQVAYLDKQIFEDYGVELPDASWTWSDMLSLAEKLTGTDPVTGKQTYGVQVDSMENANNLWFNYGMIASAYDAKVFQYGKTVEDSKVDFKIDKSIAAFQMLRDLGQYCSPQVKEGVNVAYQLTTDNDTAIRYSQNAFTHFKEAKVAGIEDRFVFLPMPAIEEGTHKGEPSMFKGCNNLAISKSSKHKDWAWEFIKFMITDEVCIQWVIDCGNIPNTPDCLTNLKAEMGEKADAIDRALSTMSDDFSNSTTEYYNNISFGPVTTTLGIVSHDLVNGTITAEDAAEQMQTAVDEYLATR